MRIYPLVAVLLAYAGSAGAAEPPRVELQTNKGVIVVELNAEKAPKTVRNFLDYVETRYYDGMIFHRVIDDWVIQGGGYTADLSAYETEPPIRNEAANGLKNLRGTIAMARGSNPHSADAEFFINLADNASLDHKARTLDDYGYCVFGRVVKGMDVADAIGDVPVHEHDGFETLPVEPVIIERATVIR